ncbi:HEPN domain-containing protein [Martelella sp. FLE1502]
MPFTHEEIQCLPKVLSAPRFATYLSAMNSDKEAALSLYQWNVELSAAFLVPLQICEVSVRNSIMEAIEKSYGPNWPWEHSFLITLRDPKYGYNPRKDLRNLRHLSTTGKIVAELKFVFWQKMFTSAHDGNIWNHHFQTVFPNCDQTKTVQQLRGEAYDALDKIRQLRNRIAHHEPVFRRDITVEYDRIREVIRWTNPTAAGWVDRISQVTPINAGRP